MEQKFPEAEPYAAFSGTKHLRLFLLPVRQDAIIHFRT